jgi:hypothetical protein
VAIEHALDEGGEGDGRGEHNQPDHRAAMGQKRWHEVFIGGCGQSSKRKISESGIQEAILELKPLRRFSGS